MKKNIEQIKVFVAACLFVQPVCLPAQSSSVSEGVLSNAEMRAQWLQTNFSTPLQRAQWWASNADTIAEYRRLHPTASELEWASNVVQNIKAPPQWPEPSKKQETLKHCAEILRSAVDANQIKTACSNLTNQCEAAALRSFSELTISTLNEFAALLSNPGLDTYIGAGCTATMYTPTNYFFMLFWSDKGPVRQAEKRTPDAQDVVVSAHFYDNGKLSRFEIYSPKTRGFSFKEDGQLNIYWGLKLAETNP